MLEFWKIVIVAAICCFQITVALRVNVDIGNGRKNCPQCNCPVKESRNTGIHVGIGIGLNECPHCDTNCPPYAIFDYVVVGAGSVGCIVATRLSEDRNVSVLLLEAGGEPPAYSESPGLFFLQLLSQYDWKYFTTKQRFTNLGEYWPRGKMLGGTGSMSVSYLLRANRRDFDFWVDQGCQNWSWDENLPYYKKFENYLVPNADTNIHGTGGPINVTIPGMDDPTINLFVKSAMENGLKYSDPNDGSQSGVYHMPVNINNRKRQSSFTNYLKPIMKSRQNLVVETFAFVDRILFEKEKTATALLYTKNGKQYKVGIRKELIVCAGAINSPQLLMLSGIGPKAHLQKFGIKVVADLPVGQNLFDDYVVWNLHSPKLPTIIDPSYLVLGIAFFNAKNESDYPDTEMVMLRDWTLTISYIVSLRPEARGQILLKSTNPRIHPEIIYQYMSVKKDLETHMNGLRKASEILKGMKFTETVAPQCLLHRKNSYEYWKCRVTSLGQSAWHNAGTCRMGSSLSKTSVVDCYLKVIGVNNLRVLDTSVFPRPLSANPQATLFMMAEKVVDFIKRSN